MFKTLAKEKDSEMLSFKFQNFSRVPTSMLNHVGSQVEPSNNKPRLGKTKKISMKNAVIKFLWIRDADILYNTATNTNIFNARLAAIPSLIWGFLKSGMESVVVSIGRSFSSITPKLVA